VWPHFFVKQTGLRLGMVFALIPERYHSSFIRVMGVIAIFASVVGLFQLFTVWK